jgi:excisionase family DNA binding protein
MPKNHEEVYPVYFTTGVVAKYCGVSKVTVLRWIEKGNLIAFKLPGGQNRIHRDDFFAFANKHGIPVKRDQMK